MLRLLDLLVGAVDQMNTFSARMQTTESASFRLGLQSYKVQLSTSYTG